MKKYKKLTFKFLRDTEEVNVFRQYTKAESFYAGSILFTSNSTFKLLEESLIAKGDCILNKIIKINSIRSRANNLVNLYKDKIANPNKDLIENVEEMRDCLAGDMLENIETYQEICVVYNELTSHEESFDCDDERETIIEKVDEILFDRFGRESWIVPETEYYNEPSCKLKVKYSDSGIPNFRESYVNEFMNDLNLYLNKREDKDIIREESIVDNDDIFWELEIDYRYAESYRQMKRALIDTDETKKICNETLVVDNVGELLKEQRNFLKMTMREVSEITGLTTGYLSRLENGSSTPSLEALTKLCTAYGVANIDNFLKGDNFNSNKERETVDLESVLAREIVSLGGEPIDSSDKITILKLAKLLSSTSSGESKEALKDIVNNLIKLEENKN